MTKDGGEKHSKKLSAISFRCVLYTILAIVWMGAIFNFSSKPSDESTEQSNAVGMFVGKIVIPDFEEWSEEEQLRFAEDWEYPIRKTAHMTEYAILGFLLLGALSGKQSISRRWAAFFALAGAVLYAGTDEIHQYFVPGRACRIYDVGFDAAGALIGILAGMVRRKRQ